MKSKLLMTLVLFSITVSCTKELVRETAIVQNSDSGKEVTLTACIEDDQTKTNIVYESLQFKVSWVEKDSISVIDANNYRATFYATNIDPEDPSKCTFTTSEAQKGFGTLGFKAVYPASLYVKPEDVVTKASFDIPAVIEQDGGCYSLPAVQEYVSSLSAKDYPMAAYATSSKVLNFRNLCGIMRIGVRTTNPGNIRSIKVKDAAAEPKGMSGSFYMNWEKLQIGFVEGSEGVTLDCSKANGGTGVPVVENELTYFNIAVPAGQYTPAITVVKMDGSEETLTAKKSIVIEKGKYNNMNVNATELVWDYAYGQVSCYIGTPGSTVNVDITPYKVNADCFTFGEATKAPVAQAAKVIWADKSLVDDVNSLIPAISGNTLSLALPSEKYGNAIVAIYPDALCTEGTSLWTYHIWVPKDDPTQTIDYTSSTIAGVPTYMMPLALGAIEKNNSDADFKNSAVGFQYQAYNRIPILRRAIYAAPKEGFDVSYEVEINKAADVAANSLQCTKSGFETNNTILEGIANKAKYAVDYYTRNPNHVIFSYKQTTGKENYYTWFTLNVGRNTDPDVMQGSKLWGDGEHVKTVYDPCPAGYRVPSVDQINLKYACTQRIWDPTVTVAPEKVGTDEVSRGAIIKNGEGTVIDYLLNQGSISHYFDSPRYMNTDAYQGWHSNATIGKKDPGDLTYPTSSAGCSLRLLFRYGTTSNKFSYRALMVNLTSAIRCVKCDDVPAE